MATPLPRLSEIIAHLQFLREAHGDLPLVVDDPATGWPMVPSMAYRRPAQDARAEWHRLGPCVAVTGGSGPACHPLLPDAPRPVEAREGSDGRA